MAIYIVSAERALYPGLSLHRDTISTTMIILVWTAFKILASSTAVYYIVETLRRLFFHPLLAFPGPKLAAATDLYTAYYDLVVGGGLVDQLEILHRIYGECTFVVPSNHFDVDMTICRACRADRPKPGTAPCEVLR